MPNRKLTYATAMKVKELLNQNSSPSRKFTSRQVRDKLGLDVSISVIDSIRTGRTYNTRIHAKASKLTYREHRIIRNALKQKVPPAHLAVRFGVSVSTIGKVKKLGLGRERQNNER